MKKRVLILIPAHNEAGSIGNVLQSLALHAPGFDRLVINDGSTDETRRLVRELGERQIRLPVNLGYGNALQTGMIYALKKGYDLIVTFDADGQHRAEDVVPLVECLIEHDLDMVIGSRFGRDTHYEGPLGRRMGMAILSWLTKPLTGRRVRDTTSGFKAMTSTACSNLVDGVFHDFHIEALVRLSLLGYRIAEHPVTVLSRKKGQSMHSLASAVQYPLRTLLVTLATAADAIILRRKK